MPGKNDSARQADHDWRCGDAFSRIVEKFSGGFEADVAMTRACVRGEREESGLSADSISFDVGALSDHVREIRGCIVTVVSTSTYICEWMECE